MTKNEEDLRGAYKWNATWLLIAIACRKFFNDCLNTLCSWVYRGFRWLGATALAIIALIGIAALFYLSVLFCQHGWDWSIEFLRLKFSELYLVV